MWKTLSGGRKRPKLRQIIVGCSPKDSREVGFVKKHSDKTFSTAVGVYPHDSNLLTDEVIEELRNLVKTEKKVVAIGEIGLDFYRNSQPTVVQEGFPGAIKAGERA